MAIHIARDYNPASTGYAGIPAGHTRQFTSLWYNICLFLNKILGYSVVGSTSWNIDATNFATGITVSSFTSGPNVVITTNVAHNLVNGQVVYITGATGNGTLNGSWIVANVGTNTATLLNNNGGNGGYNSNSATLYAAAPRLASGSGATAASINQHGTYVVDIPIAARTVLAGTSPAGDVNRMLVMKSSLYPTKNSGIFKITAVDTVNNRYTIDYRSTDAPPPELSTLTWWLYEGEVQVSNYIYNFDASLPSTVNGATNTTPIVVSTSSAHPFVTGQRVLITNVGGNTGANGTWTITYVDATHFSLNNSIGNGAFSSNGSASFVGYAGGLGGPNSRMILQSPHASGWQARVCNEPFNVGLPVITVASGNNGNAQGDFPINGTTSHIAQFLDSNPTGGFVNTVPGGGCYNNNNNASRITLVGDDGGQAVFMYSKILGGAGNNGIMVFGVPDNEPIPNYPNTDRSFTYGSLNVPSGDYGTIQLRMGNQFNGGFGFRAVIPEFVALVGWANMDGTSGTNPFYSANAGDSPFTSSTEVIPIEVWGGTTVDPQLAIPTPTAGVVPYGYDQRFMGTAPFLRNGRTNFGAFTQSTDSTATVNVSAATQTSPIQITTSSINAFATGQTVIISGVTGNTNANGTFVISVIDNTHFTLNNSSGNAAYTGGGTVTGTPHWLHLQNGIYLLWNGAGGLNP